MFFSACNTLTPAENPPSDISPKPDNDELVHTEIEKSAASKPDTDDASIKISKATYIEIYKSDRILKLYADGKLKETFKIALGSSPEGNKNKQGDKRTPTGSYFVCSRNEKSRFTLFLGVSYPNAIDAKRGLDKGLINEDVYKQIVAAYETKTCPSWQTPLGGAIGIHGGGTASDWTLGCIALSDDDIKTLWKYAKLKTPIEIYE